MFTNLASGELCSAVSMCVVMLCAAAVSEKTRHVRFARFKLAPGERTSAPLWAGPCASGLGQPGKLQYLVISLGLATLPTLY